MKKTAFIVSALIIAIPCSVLAEITTKMVKNPDGSVSRIYSQDGKEIAREVQEIGGPMKMIGTIPDGIVKEYHPNGIVSFERPFKGGKREGTLKKYYADGKINYTIDYKNDKREGLSKVYRENGTLYADWNFKDNLADGITKIYHENEKVMFEWQYVKDKRQGINNEYYENGKLKTAWNFQDDQKEGISKTYYESGKLLRESNYSKDKLTGKQTEYYETGSVKSVETFDNGKQLTKTEYDPQGKITREQSLTPTDTKGKAPAPGGPGITSTPDAATKDANKPSGQKAAP
jgi:antitoxin component YwqK of YwqJK toxin-antitoxin module